METFSLLLKRLAKGWPLMLPLAAILAGAPAHAQEMKWDFYKRSDLTPPAAVLTFGVPKSDNQQFRASCEGSDPIITAFAADVAGLPEGAPLNVVFTGDAYTETVKARASGVQGGGEITGFVFDTRPDDPLWVAMAELEQISYSAGGKPPVPLALDGSNAQVKDFLDTCDKYAMQEVAEDPIQGIEGKAGITEKQAFKEAKEVDTIDAYEAFLKNFPNGLRADMARNRINRLSRKGEVDVMPSGPAPTMKTVDLGPGSAAWTNYNLALEDGAASVYAAGVDAKGMKLTTYCTPAKRILMILEQTKAGSYPQYDARVAEGLSDPVGAGYDPSAGKMIVSFPNGAEVPGAAHYQPESGSISVSSTTDPSGFLPNGEEVQNLLTQSTVSFTAPPFKATFQLKGSSKALCDVVNRCEAVVPACGAEGVLIEKAPGCGLGEIRIDNQCMSREEARTYCGPGYKPSEGTCEPR
ncbi:hypothetical protein A7A08_01022 [Methyloligella halotolerans]|uniref:Uncharacterized protein n=1 Tax=Methyloligella halotolerans TaxID=1177755 RepID=A0A1E2S0K9_9HYPH|nr:hypothetical protein [Methyloligella halotolerans]ODA67855.1 hypothetical protein A7A08_01022 [Methyloligella halotolerans]